MADESSGESTLTVLVALGINVGIALMKAVAGVLTMLTGTDRVLLCARIDFDDNLGAADLERACVRIAAELTAEFPALDEIFLEPVPREDQDLRARVLARYGQEFVAD